MKQPDDLFLLINTMTGPEKRYFKLFSALYDRDKNYLKVFDHIARQKSDYNEKELINKFKKEKWVKSLSNTKYELFNAILNSLEVYHKNDSVEAKLASLMNQLNLLHAKRLFRAAKKVITKIERLALKHEMHHYLLMANSVRVIIMSKEMNVKEIEQYLKGAEFENEKKYLKCLENNSEYLDINLRVTKAAELYIKTNEARELRELSDSDLLKSPDKALTFYARRNYYYINYLCKSKLENLNEEVYLQQKEWIDYLESEKDLLASRAGIYLGALIRYLSAINTIKLRTESESVFIKAKNFYQNLPVKLQTDNIKSMFMGIALNYLQGQIATFKLQKAVVLWESIRNLVPDQSISGEWQIVIPVNLSYAHFLLQEYRKANMYLNNIINYTGDSRPDIQAYARIYMLYVNYELGNYDALTSICQSSIRYLQKRGLLGKYEKRVIRFFQKDVFRLPESDDNSILFHNLKNDFVKLSSFSKTHAAQKFDIVSWLDSKIEGRSFAEVLKEKSIKAQ